MENLEYTISQNYSANVVTSHPIALGITNGLITTSTIWLFWTIFTIVLAAPLASNQLKQFACVGTRWISDNILDYKNNLIAFLVETLGWSWDQATSFVFSLFPSNYKAATTIIQSDPQTINAMNKNITILFIIATILVILFSLGIASLLIRSYKLDVYSIVKSNLIMAPIIVAIEIGFFSYITMGYMAYNPATIVQDLIQQINSYVLSLIS